MNKTPFDLSGQVAVITGSSRGIGRASAELLAQLGAKVVISSRKADACKEVADGINKAGGDAHVIPCNISRREEVGALEQARSMSMFATMASDFGEARERTTAVAAAKVQVGKSGKFIGQQSIQLHGGIGMTQEAKIGHYFKRLTMIENTFGDSEYHLRRVSDAGGLV